MIKDAKPIPRRLIFLLLHLFTSLWISAEPVSNTREGIIISAEATLEANGRTRIKCTLTNSSPYVLGSVFARSPSKSFKFKLLDSNKNDLKQVEKWAAVHAQVESNDESLGKRSLSGLCLQPSETQDFQFYLEDAYEENAARGSVLEVKWISFYSQPGGTITMAQTKGADGVIVPQHEVSNHFPGVWTFDVSLPLPKKLEGKTGPTLIKLKDATSPPGYLGGVSSTSKDITISAEANLDTDGRTLVSCELVNRSLHPIAIGRMNEKTTRFQFKLVDLSGNLIKQDDKWATANNQDVSYQKSLDKIETTEIFLHPSEKQKFQFYLEDAYGKAATRGRVLEVKWNSYYTPPGETVAVSERETPNGEIILRHQAENHFPGIWTFSVSLPLTKMDDNEGSSPTINPNPTPVQSADPPPPANASTPSSLPESAQSWWWALLLIPLVMVIRKLAFIRTP